MHKNVLLVVIDQFRADLLHGPLANIAHTPNLDALAAQSTVYKRHFTVTAPCGPSRASLLTGQYAMNHRAIHNGAPLSDRHTNLALEARKLGYDPLLFGYGEIQPDPASLAPLDPARRTYTLPMRGFTGVVEMQSEAWRWLAHLRTKATTSRTAAPKTPSGSTGPGTGRLAAPPSTTRKTATRRF